MRRLSSRTGYGVAAVAAVGVDVVAGAEAGGVAVVAGAVPAFVCAGAVCCVAVAFAAACVTSGSCEDCDKSVEVAAAALVGSGALISRNARPASPGFARR